MLILRTLQGEAHRIWEEALRHYDHKDDGIPEYNTEVEVSSKQCSIEAKNNTLHSSTTFPPLLSLQSLRRTEKN